MIGGARVLVPEGFQRSRNDLEPQSRSYSVWSLSNMSQDVSWGRWQLLTLVSFPCKLTSISPQWGIFHAPGYHSGWSDHNDSTTSKGQTTWPGFRFSRPWFCSIFTVSSPVRFFPFDEFINSSETTHVHTTVLAQKLQTVLVIRIKRTVYDLVDALANVSPRTVIFWSCIQWVSVGIRRWQGCLCANMGGCATDRCPCRKGGRECDPDVCIQCKAR